MKVQRPAGRHGHFINTALQRGERRFQAAVTASAVFIRHRNTAEAVPTRVTVDNHRGVMSSEVETSRDKTLNLTLRNSSTWLGMTMER
jgi:hypothetical protein